jgi:LysM repeat protein
MVLLLGGLAFGLAAMACGGGGSPEEEGNGERITDPARVPSSTPVQNPTLYKIQGNQVTLAGGGTSQLTPVAGKTPAGGKSYTVKSGDTCSEIAASHGVTLDALVKANPTMCDTLNVGDVVRIPAAAATPTQTSGGLTSNPTVRATATKAPTSGTGGSGKTYTVTSGDTCADIAASYGVSIADIIALNGLSPDCPLQVGQTVKIP